MAQVILLGKSFLDWPFCDAGLHSTVSPALVCPSISAQNRRSLRGEVVGIFGSIEENYAELRTTPCVPPSGSPMTVYSAEVSNI